MLSTVACCVQVEDIVDTGTTGSALKAWFEDRQAASVKLISLLSKPSRRSIDFEPDYVGFTIEDRFVVGYGLDFNEEYRTLPYIGVLREDLYTTD